MSTHFAEMLSQRFNLTEVELQVLLKNIRQLNRQERRYYYDQIKPREREFQEYLQQAAKHLAAEEKKEWVRITSRNMLINGGDPDLVDCIVMNALGRLKVYNDMRELADTEGVKLKAMTSFGGLSMLLILMTALAGLAGYLLYR